MTLPPFRVKREASILRRLPLWPYNWAINWLNFAQEKNRKGNITVYMQNYYFQLMYKKKTGA